MQIYLSQLIEEDELKYLVNKYNCGLETIDFSIADNLDKRIDSLTKKYSTNYQNIDLSVHGPYFDLIPATFDSLIKDVVLLRFNQAYNSAKKIKAKYIIFHSGFLKDIYFYESWLANSIAFWQEFLQDKDDSLPIYIENAFESEPIYLAQLIDDINKPYFKACLDFGHANIQNNDLEYWIKTLNNRISHFHFHNNNGIKDQHQSLLKGNIDYKHILKLLKDYNIEADITLEMSSLSALEESINLIRGKI